MKKQHCQNTDKFQNTIGTYLFIGDDLHSTTDVKFPTDGIMKTEQIENPKDQESLDYLRLPEISSNMNMDIKLEHDLSSLKSEQSQSDQMSLEYLNLQEMWSNTNVDIKLEHDFSALDYKTEIPDIHIKDEIDDVHIKNFDVIIKDEAAIDQNM